ncbi:MAG: DNA methylase N-4/N-6 domain protein [Promethearchaeota archaeon CR_4]|nr:MAG: DNA methylase N-4/N-6 domain protein [Candidatus Lokiarchaeota archaeon CR_4]
MSDKKSIQVTLFDQSSPPLRNKKELANFLKNFSRSTDLPDAPKTSLDAVSIRDQDVIRFTNNYWTEKQRQSSPIHEISYRACYKPQLPRFFIQRLSPLQGIIYDPFSGRGTTALEAGLLGRNVIVNDINPLSQILARPRFFPPSISELKSRLQTIPDQSNLSPDIDLSMFFEKQTLTEILSLRAYLKNRRETGSEDEIDAWIRMVATNRLTGHSPGFFSAYTLPPNQAVSPERQIKINVKYGQVPPHRNVREIIIKKSKSLLRGLTSEERRNLQKTGTRAIFLAEDARHTNVIQSESVDLVVTSPPFLDVVQYAQDNWLRCWFNAIDGSSVAQKITVLKNIAAWEAFIGDVLKEIFRIVKKGGWVAFEVGEVRNGKIKLDEHVVPLGLDAGFTCAGILFNSQTFTKTSNIWGVNNNTRGTNTNRVVLFQKI